MEKEFLFDEDLNIMVRKVIVDNKLDFNGINIKSVLVEPYISKKVAGRCIRPNNELKFFGDFDYLLEFSKTLWDNLKEETKELLVLHELKHVLVTTNKNGEPVYKVAPHDVQDFFSIISKHGVNWLDEIKVTSAAVYDFKDDEKEKLKIKI